MTTRRVELREELRSAEIPEHSSCSNQAVVSVMTDSGEGGRVSVRNTSSESAQKQLAFLHPP